MADNVFIKHIGKLNLDENFSLKPQPHQLQIENPYTGSKESCTSA
jgi:hypothetical protein